MNPSDTPVPLSHTSSPTPDYSLLHRRSLGTSTAYSCRPAVTASHTPAEYSTRSSRRVPTPKRPRARNGSLVHPPRPPSERHDRVSPPMPAAAAPCPPCQLRSQGTSLRPRIARLVCGLSGVRPDPMWSGLWGASAAAGPTRLSRSTCPSRRGVPSPACACAAGRVWCS